MDEHAVRTEAQTHADATVAGDFKTAGSSLTEEAMAQAGDVMKQMPRNLATGEVGTITTDGEAFTVLINYAGTTKEGAPASATVESRWEDRDGVPKLASMKVV